MYYKMATLPGDWVKASGGVKYDLIIGTKKGPFSFLHIPTNQGHYKCRDDLIKNPL